ncbi:MAG TPA: hypothetical protein VHE81_13395, partial [Lacipirellulaceae bacterium]|nr:hypothetical protein [Lacipirellulaceae bacterium]
MSFDDPVRIDATIQSQATRKGQMRAERIDDCSGVNWFVGHRCVARSSVAEKLQERLTKSTAKHAKDA